MEGNRVAEGIGPRRVVTGNDAQGRSCDAMSRQPSSAIMRSISSRRSSIARAAPASPPAAVPYSVARPMSTASRAERERFHDVRAAAKAAVDDHRDALADRVDDLRQRLDRRREPSRCARRDSTRSPRRRRNRPPARVVGGVQAFHDQAVRP